MNCSFFCSHNSGLLHPVHFLEQPLSHSPILFPGPSTSTGYRILAANMSSFFFLRFGKMNDQIGCLVLPLAINHAATKPDFIPFIQLLTLVKCQWMIVDVSSFDALAALRLFLHPERCPVLSRILLLCPGLSSFPRKL